MRTPSINGNRRQKNKPGRVRPAAPPGQAAAESAPLASGASRPWLAWLGLALLALLAYLPALRAGFVWDDEALTENLKVKTLGGLWGIWTDPRQMHKETHYWPLVYSSFWLEHLLFGLKPFVYHLDNILLHGAACVLLWRVLKKLAVPGAWLAAAIFAVHPVHAESVAWVIERKDVLSGAFYFAAALAYLRFYETAGPGRWKAYGLALLLFTAALLSKSIALGLPLALGIALWWRQGRLSWRDGVSLAPLAALAALVTLGDLYLYTGYQLMFEPRLAWPGRILQAAGACWFYLGKLAWPHPLVTFYPLWNLRPASPLAWAPLAAGAGLMAGLWAARGRLGRGPVAALAFFGMTLAPVLGVMDFGFMHFSWVADRFQYLASAGPIALAAAGLARLGERKWPGGAAARAGAVLLLAILGGLCLRQTTYYRDSLTLFRANLAACPGSWAAHYMYGWNLVELGRYQEAATHLSEAIRLSPTPDTNATWYLAEALAKLQRPKEAEYYYRETLRLKPNYPIALNNYGLLLAGQERLEEAVAAYRESLRRRPASADTLCNLGNALRRLGRLAEAEQSLREAVRLDPNRVEYRFNLATGLSARRKLEEARREFEAALRLDPRCAMAHDSLGLLLLDLGRPEEAARCFQEAVRLEPQNAGPRFNLGEAFGRLNRKEEAMGSYREALRLDPNLVEARERLRALGAAAP